MKDTSLKRLADYYKESSREQALELIVQASKLLEDESILLDDDEDIEHYENVISKLQEARNALASGPIYKDWDFS